MAHAEHVDHRLRNLRALRVREVGRQPHVGVEVGDLRDGHRAQHDVLLRHEAKGGSEVSDAGVLAVDSHRAGGLAVRRLAALRTSVHACRLSRNGETEADKDWAGAAVVEEDGETEAGRRPGGLSTHQREEEGGLASAARAHDGAEPPGHQAARDTVQQLLAIG